MEKEKDKEKKPSFQKQEERLKINASFEEAIAVLLQGKEKDKQHTLQKS